MSKRSKDNKGGDDALRMEDIVPPFAKSKTRPRKTSTANPPSAKEQPASESAARLDLPSFDVAEKIMSAQRKKTAARRSGPRAARRPISNAGRPASAIPAEIPLLSEHQRIIRQIVARDVERLCNEPS